MKKNKKIIEIKGGIGNQLFQLAYSKYLSKEKNIEVILNLHWFKENKRVFLLDKFIKNFDQYSLDFTKRNFFKNENIISFLIEKNIFSPKNISGYWQSNLYAKYLLKSELNSETIKEKGFNNYYIFHLRMGDFRTSKDHSLIPFEFYKKNLKFFEDKKIFILAEDVNDAEKLRKFIGDNSIEIFENDELATFNFIYNSNGGIISNSTFCWWPVYFSEKKKVWISSNYWTNKRKFIESDVYLEDILILNPR